MRKLAQFNRRFMASGFGLVVVLAVLLEAIVLPVRMVQAAAGDCSKQIPVTTGMSACQREAYTEGAFMFDVADASGACVTGGSVDLTGSDNRQKAYNYFKDQGLADFQAAAIVGNLIAESSVDPTSNQNGGGAGRGIAQWSVDARWQTLIKWAGSRDVFALDTQLDFMWAELNGEAPPSDFTAVLANLKKQTNVEDATAWFMGTVNAGKFPGNEVDSVTQSYIAKYGRFGGYEDPGTPHLDKRIIAAKGVLSDNGGSPTGDISTTSVSGASVGCNTAGSVDCTSDTTPTSLSETRQKVVCLAEAEYKLWENGTMKPDGSEPYAFYKYSYGANQEWCAYFVSWIYKQAGYMLVEDGKNGIIAAVDGIRDLGEAGGRFEYHAAGPSYTPVPGDIIVHKQGGESHVNIVISVNTAKKTMEIIGGNQGGSGPNQTSAVTKYTDTAFSGVDNITGYVSPTK